MLQPTEQWQWQLNQSNNQLFLDIDASMAFTTAFEHKQLTDEVLNDNSFCINDAAYYQQVVAALTDLQQWTTPEVVQIALNATAAHRFYKPTMPKSWFFKTNLTDQVNNLPDEATCLLYTEFGCAQFLTVEQGERASLKMLLDSELQLNESRAMTQFEVIKVMNDRQFSLAEMQHLQQAQQLRYA